MSTFPTRFLVVGQALKIAIDRADGVEGIKVKGRTYSFVPKLRYGFFSRSHRAPLGLGYGLRFSHRPLGTCGRRCNSEKHPVWANFSTLGAMIHHPALQGLSRQTGHGFAPIRPASRPRPPKTRSMAGTKA